MQPLASPPRDHFTRRRHCIHYAAGTFRFLYFFPLPSSQSIYRILHFTVTITSASLFLATKCNLTNVLPMYIHAVPCTHVYPRTRKGCVLVRTRADLSAFSKFILFFHTYNFYIYIICTIVINAYAL